MHGSKKTLHRAELRRNEEDIAERVKLNPEDATKFFPEVRGRLSLTPRWRLKSDKITLA